MNLYSLWAANKKLQDRVPGAGVYINAQLHRSVTALTVLQAAAQVHRLTEIDDDSYGGTVDMTPVNIVLSAETFPCGDADTAAPQCYSSSKASFNWF